MLRANAGIQGWQGKPGRLPAEETLQFEKKNSSHPPNRSHSCLLSLQRRNAGGSPGAAVCKLLRPGKLGFLRGRFDFSSERLRFFLTCLLKKRKTPQAPPEP